MSAWPISVAALLIGYWERNRSKMFTEKPLDSYFTEKTKRTIPLVVRNYVMKEGSCEKP